MVKNKDLIPLWLTILVTAFLYFFTRLGFVYSVFFDFDMPRIALIVQDFLSSGTFMTSQSYMQESVWLNIPWGPSLIFFYSVFLKISSDPLIISYFLTAFHFLGIVVMIVLGWRYFSPTTGVFAGLLLATNPYWVTYSRIIYQPAPIITFIVISMYFLISAIRDKNYFSAMFLPASWVVLFQMYIPTYIFILFSLIYGLFNFKSINKKGLLVGILVSLFLMLPVVKFYKDNPYYIKRFIDAPARFTPPEKTVGERLEKVLLSYVEIPVGGMFNWQTGYAYEDFKIYFPEYKVIRLISSILFLTSLVYFTVSSIIKRSLLRLLVLLWSVGVVLSLMILWVTDLVPRYFLISIPASMLLIAISVGDLMYFLRKNKMTMYLLFCLPLLLATFWTAQSIKYDQFVKSYSYPEGRMYDIAETSYLHFINANLEVKKMALVDGCQKYIVKNDIDTYYDVWLETRYVLKYIYHNNYTDRPEDVDQNCYYIIGYEKLAKFLGVSGYQKSGPFVVFKYPKN